MEQFASLWASLDGRRRVIVILATIAVFGLVLGMSRLANTPTQALLYSGLDGPTSGDVVAALDQRGVAYSVKGTAIYVPANQRDELRLSLAGEGLPKAGQAGYELLDDISGFGTTSQMFDAAHWRAIEGELSRTILSNPGFRSARVHIGRGTENVFSRDREKTASVTAIAVAGSLSMSQARALKYLVSAAVTGLSPENVSVIDGQTGHVFIDDAEGLSNANGSDREAILRKNVLGLLEARVGEGNAVVQVSIESAMESESIIQKTLDPKSRVAISTEVEESTSDATEPATGVTVASNLPAGDAAVGESGRSQNNQTRELTNYEVSETHREVVRQPGAVRKISVAALVNAIEVVGEEGQIIIETRSDDELESLRGLIASAVGYDEARGDTITLESMEFRPAPLQGVEAEPGFAESLNLDLMQIAQQVVLAIVVLALGLGVVRPIAMQAQIRPPVAAALESPSPDELPVLNGDIDLGSGSFNVVDVDAGQLGSDLMETTAENGTEPIERLRQLIEDRQDESIEVLRGWIEQDEKVA